MSIEPELRSGDVLGVPAWDPERDVDPVVPDTIPDWLLEAPVSTQEPRCDCGCSVLVHDGEPVEEPVRWAVPGVWPEEPALPAGRLLDENGWVAEPPATRALTAALCPSRGCRAPLRRAQDPVR